VPPDLFPGDAKTAEPSIGYGESETTAGFRSDPGMSFPTGQREPERYRERAAACRRFSERAYTPELRDSYLHLATSYDGLAETAEQLARLDG